MIKVVDQEYEDFPVISFKTAELQLRKLSVINLDVETNPETNELIMVQAGNKDVQFIFLQDFHKLKAVLESGIVRLHNAKFDLRILQRIGIYPKKVEDTFLQEMILHTGKFAKPLITMKYCSLANTVKRYCNVKLEKGIRMQGYITKEFIEYGTKDIIYLEDISAAQKKKLTLYQLDMAVNLDNNFVKVLAYIEDCGFKMDKEGWEKKVTEDEFQLQQAVNQLDSLTSQDEKLEEFYSTEVSLFGSKTVFDYKWTSPSDVQIIFEKLGFNWNKNNKPTTQASVIENDKDKHPLIPAYINFVKARKKCTSFGRNYLEVLEKYPDNRIRTDFKQIITTGRMSASGNNDDDETIGVNLQQIPKKSEERKYFITNEGNSLIISDYAGQETRILAQLAQDPTYSQYISDPSKDLHCLMMQCLWPDRFAHLEHSVLKQKFPKERNYAKPGTFSIPYGGDGKTIARNCKVSIEQGIKAYETFMNMFSGLKIFFANSEKQALRNGYILINNITGRKVFLQGYEEYRELRIKSTLTHEEYKFKTRYENIISRRARNYPIQGTGSDMVKAASVLIYKALEKENLLNTVLWPCIVHDELDLEAPDEIAPYIAEIVKTKMEEAGKIFCPDIPIIVEPEIKKTWL